MAGTTLIPSLNPVVLSSGFDFRPFPDVAPFTIREGATFEYTLSAIRVWLRDELTPYLLTHSSQATWDANAATLTEQVNAALAGQSVEVTAALNNAVQEVITATIPITTPIVFGALGWFDVEQYGAVGDGVTQDQAAIQAAIDAAHDKYVATGVQQRVYFASKTYLVGATETQNPVWALMLKSGVELYGKGTIKTATGSYWVGTDYAIIRSPDEGTTDTAIVGLSFDGNTAAIQVPGGNNQASNIVLRASKNLRIQDVKSYSTAGMGIMVAGHSDNLSQNVVIEGCQVTSCGNIGIQVSQFDGLKIINNEVSWTHDNGIDIFGEPESHNAADGSKGVNFEISGNHVHDCGNGIFPETVAKGVIQNNNIRNVGDGIHVNRWNAEPNNILISGNYIYGAQSAIRLTGDTGGVTIRGNVLEWFNTAGVDLGGAGRVSGYYILDNTMNGNAETIPLVLIRSGTDQTASILHRGTVTRSKNRAYDTVNQGPGAINSSWSPAVAPGDF